MIATTTRPPGALRRNAGRPEADRKIEDRNIDIFLSAMLLSRVFMVVTGRTDGNRDAPAGFAPEPV
jgi:hypothetical protein